MNSATSIEKPFTAPKHKEGAGRSGSQPAGLPEQVDSGFRPWHFFVLASLMAATAAVVMSRQSTPEHLVLISLTIGAAGLAAAGFYRTLAPLATDDPSSFTEPLTDRTRAVLEREKVLTLRAIKDLEFDRAMGKLSAKDFEDMAGRLRTRAIALMKQLDDGGSGYRAIIERELATRIGRKSQIIAAVPAAAGTCAACGTGNDADAVFCKRCGARLVEERPKGRNS